MRWKLQMRSTLHRLAFGGAEEQALLLLHLRVPPLLSLLLLLQRAQRQLRTRPTANERSMGRRHDDALRSRHGKQMISSAVSSR